MFQNRLDKLLLADNTIFVLVHLGKRTLGNKLLASLGWIAMFQQSVQVPDNLLDLIETDVPVTVEIKNTKKFLQNFLRGTKLKTIVDHHKLHKINNTISIFIINSKDMWF